MHIWNIMLSEQILVAVLFFFISFEKTAFDSNGKEIYHLQHFCRLQVLLQKVFSVRMTPHHDTGNNLWYFIFLFQEISSKNLFSCWGDTWWCWQPLMGPCAMLFLNVLNLQQPAEWIAFRFWRSGTKKSWKTNKQTNTKINKAFSSMALFVWSSPVQNIYCIYPRVGIYWNLTKVMLRACVLA